MIDAEVIAHMAGKEEEPNGRKTLDIWFPTVVRYIGVVLLLYAAVIDRGQNPALLPTSAGMILFKSIYGAGNGGSS